MKSFQKTKYIGVVYYESERRRDKCYYITYKTGGKFNREKVGWASEGISPLYASELRADRTRGARHGEKFTRLSLTEGVNLYLESLNGTVSDKAIKDITGRLAKAQYFFGFSVTLYDIKPEHIVKYINHLKNARTEKGRKYAPQTILHYYAVLRQMYNYLIDIGKYEGKSPLTKETRNSVPKINNEIINYLSEDEIKNMLGALDKYNDQSLANFFRFALFTGMRKGEIFKLTTADVDFDKHLVTIRAPKSGQDEVIEASSAAVDVIKKQISFMKKSRISSPHVFYSSATGKKRTDVKRQFETLKKLAGIDRPFRFHDLRHNFATMLIDSGADIYTVQKLLTHKDPSTTQKYAHFKTGRLKSAADAAVNGMLKG